VRLKEVADVAEELWEYRVTMMTDDALNSQAKLNRLGDEGWELVAVAVSPETRMSMAYLRRRKTALGNPGETVGPSSVR
jgi:hypothetical protein